jgi:hypothetical protein
MRGPFRHGVPALGQDPHRTAAAPRRSRTARGRPSARRVGGRRRRAGGRKHRLVASGGGRDPLPGRQDGSARQRAPAAPPERLRGG